MKALKDLSHISDREEILALAETLAEGGLETPDIDFWSYSTQFPDVPYELDHWNPYDVPYVLSIFFSLCRLAQLKEIARERVAAECRKLPPVLH